MTRRVGYYSPETARMVLEVVRYLQQSGYVIQRPGRGSQNHMPPPDPIYIRNDSGETIPPFACLQATGTVEAGGQNYITVDQPADTTGAAGPYLFNGIAEVAAGGYGIAHDGPVVRMLTDGSSVSSGDEWVPAVGAWAVEPGSGPFTAIGGDDIKTNVMRGRLGGGGGGSRLVRFELTASLSSGTGAADFQEMDGTAIGSDTLRDPEAIFAVLDTGDRGLAMLQGGQYFAVQAVCPPEPEV